jgi:GGDEF domain-containing protein
MEPRPPRHRAARPVADAPVDALLARLDDVAKGWVLALLERAPLEEMPAILAAEVAREGPRVCDAVIRALADDEDLRRLQEGGALELLASRVGELAGARGVSETSAAVDALHDVVWAAVRVALVDPDADQVAQLAERLAVVIGLVRAACLRRGANHAAHVKPLPREEGSSSHVAPLRRAAGEPEARGASGPSGPGDRSGPAEPAGRNHPLWVGAFEEELARAERTGGQLSLLLAELEDADRLIAAEDADEAMATMGRFAQALREAVRRQDILACETDERAWVIARDTGRAGAQALASRIVSRVREARPWRGAPMRVTVGVAVLGEDGHDASTLIEVAEEARFAAAASGIAVVPSGPLTDASD